jgi:hypothetical protein
VPTPYPCVQSPVPHVLDVPYQHVTNFYSQNTAWPPCPSDTQSHQNISEQPPATCHGYVPQSPSKVQNPSNIPLPPHIPLPHFPYFPAPSTHFHYQYPQPETPHHQHPLPCPPSPDVVNDNFNHDQQSTSSNYHNVINNLLQDYPELRLEDPNLESKFPYPESNHQEDSIDQYQPQYYESRDHQDAPTDQFDHKPDDYGDYDNGGDDYGYNDGGYNYGKYDNDGYYDD